MLLAKVSNGRYRPVDSTNNLIATIRRSTITVETESEPTMATTKKTPAKKSPAKQTAAKQSPAKQTAAKRAVAKRAVAKRAVAKRAVAVRTVVAQPNVANPIAAAVPVAQAAAARGREQLDDAVVLAREIVTTSVGLPFVIQARLGGLSMFEMPRVDLAAVATLLDDAKAQGATKLAAIQDRAGEITSLVVDSTKKLRDRVAA
jgi:hypothetical protein